MDYKKRIKKLQTKLQKKNIEALLISQPENRHYLSGYTGGDHGIGETSGLLLVPAKGKVHLLTDFRYKIQAERDIPWAVVDIYTKGAINLLTRLLPEIGITKLAFESHYTLFSSATTMSAAMKKKGIELVPLEGIIEKMREIKSKEEISIIRQSVRLNEEVFNNIYSRFSDFQNEIDVALAVEFTMRRKGAEGASFSTIVASGKNGAFPHAVPGKQAILKNKSLTLDMGLILNNYCSDMTRNFVVGKPTKKYIKLHRIVRNAQIAGIAAIKEGVKGCDVDSVARSVIEDAGYGKYFGHGLGHGVGLAVHEGPRLSPLNSKKLKAGMIVTVEPGIYLPGWGGIRLENMVVVQKDGCENLNENDTWLDI